MAQQRCRPGSASRHSPRLREWPGYGPLLAELSIQAINSGLRVESTIASIVSPTHPSPRPWARRSGPRHSRAGLSHAPASRFWATG